MARKLATVQINITATKPRIESDGRCRTYLGKKGAQAGGNLADDEADQPKPSACCRIHEIVRLRVPISFSTAISRILPMVMV